MVKDARKMSTAVELYVTYYAHRARKLINGLKGPLEHKAVVKKMSLVVHNFAFMTSMVLKTLSTDS